MKGTTPDGTVNGFLDRGSHFSGDLKFDDGFRIDGRFEGKITSASTPSRSIALILAAGSL